MIINCLALDPSFRNIGVVVFSYNTDTKDTTIISTSLIHTEDNRPKTIPRKLTKEVIDQTTGKKKTVKAKSKRRGNATDEHNRAIVETITQLKAIVSENNIECIMAEIPNGSENSKTALLLGMSVGSVISFATALDIPLISLAPADIKKRACEQLPEVKKGDAPTKDQIMDLVVSKYPGTESGFTQVFKSGKTRTKKGEFEHVADAVMVMEAGIRTAMFVRAAKRFD